MPGRATNYNAVNIGVNQNPNVIYACHAYSTYHSQPKLNGVTGLLRTGHARIAPSEPSHNAGRSRDVARPIRRQPGAAALMIWAAQPP
jgi:hypothetical protein